jgi:CHAT domain-containing protein
LKYTNDSASELHLHQIDKIDPDLIHLATHGYYQGFGYNSMSNNIHMLNVDENIDPMIKSGIVLASANKKGYLYSGNDGYLSAQEISRMKFSKLDLVVLSACETGLGDVIGTEGVFGLQRAFKLAGAKSIIMSLWKVPDSATAELMNFFYENYFINDWSKSKSLLEAQRSMKKQAKYASPFYWGGFILLEN